MIAVVCSGQIILGISVFFVSLLAMYEYFKSLRNAGYRPVRAVATFRVPVFCFFVSTEYQKLFSLNRYYLLKH
ncbi:hypothetical protein JCM21531_867 [Acetivibrio straminisolvens JCM 21531]|uniref:Uncharacterized protein n=1 Tax=Acetivibrio straminisolvens JCM 21531 TaxID=1294263 RepID=W4V214_9FIRM|nr:hypothetical protein JCM21531_867 [Acetivibrio straminisolvens JCM 21531]